VSISDAVRTLSKELFTADLSDEVSDGQATINLSEIMDKIRDGDTTISIGGLQGDGYKMQLDITFHDLIERRQ